MTSGTHERSGRQTLSDSPPNLVKVRRALLSASDKTGLVDLARALVRHGADVISSGGTASTLEAAGLPVRRVEDVTGFPEMMGGRIKTLHPLIHGGILARRDLDEDRRAMGDAGIEPIDLVCVNPYPFERAAARPDVTGPEAIEQIDIGGPTLVRAAAKNHPWVAVVTAPEQYAGLLAELDAHDGSTTLATRRALATAAFERTAAYDAAIAGWLRGPVAAGAAALPGRLALDLVRRASLRYGENPHQAAALYSGAAGPAAGIPAARQLAGKALSYNNLLDAAAALDLVADLAALDAGRCAAAIVKHTNPCGAALAATPAEAFEAAHAGDPLAAFGGILALSRPVDAAAAAAITAGRKFLEVIVAPAFDGAAAAALGARWPNVRLLAAGDIEHPDALLLRSITGGVLVQTPDTARPDTARWTHAAGPAPIPALVAEAAFAFTVVKHLKSNAVAITRGRRLIGQGSGQVDRLNASRQAAERAAAAMGDGAVAASDAFFPFADGPRALIDAGVAAIVQPGGSKRDRETLDLCAERGVTCLLTGVRHFRH